MNDNKIDFAHYIDHTLLAMDATESQIETLCTQAKQYHFYTVCVNSGYVPLASKLLKGSSVKVCSVIGFPLGSCLTEVKAFEAQSAIAAGAQEIDMVINVGWLKSNKFEAVTKDIESVKKACADVPLKVILETCVLTDEQIVQVCEICRELNVGFVKTSTGFSTGGATEHHVKLMRETVGKTIGVKASGAVRDQDTAKTMILAGATRIGTSSGVAIVSGKSAAPSSY